jgi:hypothetical protein
MTDVGRGNKDRSAFRCAMMPDIGPVIAREETKQSRAAKEVWIASSLRSSP